MLQSHLRRPRSVLMFSQLTTIACRSSASISLFQTKFLWYQEENSKFNWEEILRIMQWGWSKLWCTQKMVLMNGFRRKYKSFFLSFSFTVFFGGINRTFVRDELNAAIYYTISGVTKRSCLTIIFYWDHGKNKVIK